MKPSLFVFVWISSILPFVVPVARGDAPVVHSVKGGRWSSPSTWEGGKLPTAGDRVQIKHGHEVIFDARIEQPIRSIHIAGMLTFDPDRDTLLTVGLIKIQAGDDVDDGGLDVHSEMMGKVETGPDRPSLLVGTNRRPISAAHNAMIRLAIVEGLDPEVCPAIICQGGRMEFHGAPVSPTWTKLAETAKAGESVVVVRDPVVGWRVGDKVIVTATQHQYAKEEDIIPTVRSAPLTEERTIRAIDGTKLTLDTPLSGTHNVRENLRGEVALLTRNVVVESADASGVRGHTMYHRGSSGSISYAEFRHLGKKGKLGKYSLHFHKVGDTMRGASVIGASIWDSDNRWITIHGTNRLVIQDCVGYQSVGHGFFLEDGTEVDNIFDGNLAVQATAGSPLPGQILAYDRNDGAGFWWASSRNAFVRNVAVECDAYGFRLEAPNSPGSNPVMAIRGPDGQTNLEDIRLQPFVRFDANEVHSQRHYGVNLGGSDARSAQGPPTTGPDSRHPLAIRGLTIWETRWAFIPATTGLIGENLEFAHSEFGFWKANFDRQAYREIKIFQCGKAYAENVGRRPSPSNFPAPLTPVDDRPPISVITDVQPLEGTTIRVRGSASDDGSIKMVAVNGRATRPLLPDFSRWEIDLDSEAVSLTASAEDASGNVERTPHLVTVPGLMKSHSQPNVRPHP